MKPPQLRLKKFTTNQTVVQNGIDHGRSGKTKRRYLEDTQTSPFRNIYFVPESTSTSQEEVHSASVMSEDLAAVELPAKDMSNSVVNCLDS